MPGVNGISKEATESADRMMTMVREGGVTMHIMSNSSLKRYGDIEHKELIQYSDFIKSRWGYDLLQLNGNCEYEEY